MAQAKSQLWHFYLRALYVRFVACGGLRGPWRFWSGDEYSKVWTLRNQPLETQHWILAQFLRGYWKLAGWLRSSVSNHAAPQARNFLWPLALQYDKALSVAHTTALKIFWPYSNLYDISAAHMMRSGTP